MVQSVLAEGAAVLGHSSTKLTYADYLLFPDDGLRHEIINGEHYMTPAPTIRHQRISGNLYFLIRSYLEKQPIGEVFAAPCDVLLSETDILVPDLIYISNQRSHLITSKNLQGAPELAIEILSPSTRRRDQRLKRDVYERAGVEEYWLVDPERDLVEVCRRATGAFQEPLRYRRTQVLTTPLLPGLDFSLDKILA